MSISDFVPGGALFVLVPSVGANSGSNSPLGAASAPSVTAGDCDAVLLPAVEPPGVVPLEAERLEVDPGAGVGRAMAGWDADCQAGVCEVVVCVATVASPNTSSPSGNSGGNSTPIGGERRAEASGGVMDVWGAINAAPAGGCEVAADGPICLSTSDASGRTGGGVAMESEAASAADGSTATDPAMPLAWLSNSNSSGIKPPRIKPSAAAVGSAADPSSGAPLVASDLVLVCNVFVARGSGCEFDDRSAGSFGFAVVG